MMSLNVKRTKRTNLPDVGVSSGAAVLASKACVVGGASVVEEAASVGVEGELVGVSGAQAGILAEAKTKIINLIIAF